MDGIEKRCPAFSPTYTSFLCSCGVRAHPFIQEKFRMFFAPIRARSSHGIRVARFGEVVDVGDESLEKIMFKLELFDFCRETLLLKKNSRKS
ncbi:hypothetical protein CDAR_289991 [Caerostris darwini]|uniref:Uncharacterized protein n=1 Tax=Caerostris darwini TaxID=1538125 RepID=A0AAV4WZC4_9ARAC|nr:hypothetical protein CDAR_289991 [Caerostris darwini]